MPTPELLPNLIGEEINSSEPLATDVSTSKEKEKDEEPLKKVEDITETVTKQIKEAAKREQQQRESDDVPFEELDTLDFSEDEKGTNRKFPIKSGLLLVALIGGAVLFHKYRERKEYKPVAKPETAPIKESFLL